MEFIIVTGMSGAGKSIAANALEDCGFYCVDNMPPKLIGKFAELCVQSENNIHRAAIVTDMRGRKMFDDVFLEISHLEKKGHTCRILFLDAADETLINRYKETRRRHPLSENTDMTTEQALQKEREFLMQIKEKADYIINTSLMSPAQLRERIMGVFRSENDQQMHISCVSFGFKYGLPGDADLVLDVRCLPNPYYIETLKCKTGLDREVRQYVFSFEESKQMYQKIEDLLDFVLPMYQKEGKSQLLIAIGCTGGKHRSVAIAQRLNDHFTEKGFHSTAIHRDISR